ncbi:MAG: hypothetical protein GY799_24290, partial [Desulfobulbaceae bacterium]|nr:hypothetical protein [Desulfobulbaceae bacterium]
MQLLQSMPGPGPTPPGTPDPTLANVVRDDVRTSNGDFSNNESETFVLTLDWGIGDHDLESITALSNFEYDEFCDCDFTGADVFGAALQNPSTIWPTAAETGWTTRLKKADGTSNNEIYYALWSKAMGSTPDDEFNMRGAPNTCNASLMVMAF